MRLLAEPRATRSNQHGASRDARYACSAGDSASEGSVEESTMGRNLVKFKKSLMTASLIGKYDVIIVILMSRQLRKWEVFIVSLFLDGLS